MAEDQGLLSSNVSAGDDGLASQYNNLRADTKKMRQEEMTAGATINGDTLPVPVYQNTSDNEVYACDANVSTALEFLGFAISDGTDGNAIIVQHTGIVGGFTGLDEGELYYVQDAIGTIGKTPGTANILVGIAISTTEILVLKREEISYKNGTTSKNLVDASTTQNIAHGLGKIPKKVKLNFMLLLSGATGTTSHLNIVYNGVTTSIVGVQSKGGPAFAIETTFFIAGINQGNAYYQTGVITFDATNIIINWTKTGTPTGIHYILWEAEA